MKINKIAKTVKAAGELITVEVPNSGLWLGTSSVLYNIPEFTVLDIDGINTALGIDEKKADKIVYGNKEPKDMPEICFDDFNNSDKNADEGGIEISYKGINLGFAYEYGKTDGAGIMFNTDYLAPLNDFAQKQIYIRQSGKMPYIVVKNGMIIKAIICAFEPTEEMTSEFYRAKQFFKGGN